MATSLRLFSIQSPLYVILFTLACFCIWEAFGFIIVTKRETASIASQIIEDNIISQSSEKTYSSPDNSPLAVSSSQLYCVDGDCTCKSLGCFECSKAEIEIPELKEFCESEHSFQKFECERGNLLKYASCQSENFSPFRPVEEMRFLKFEVFCFILSIISYVVVWKRKRVGERVIVKRIQKLIEDPI
ncbi:hypothetical protein LOD99_14795 [Oopsacas minuta]|uniref:Uncharacterized protein n=1 Tax=Oopsacas minuta TaxID=111878 RepID=A0AAV7KGA9_9METZ|nr:hypothetical protein LOD99_14795 [Oopsacas minuta]